VTVTAACLFYLTGWLRRRLDARAPERNWLVGRGGAPAMQRWLQRNAVLGLLVLALVFAAGTAVGGREGLYAYGGLRALRTLRSGEGAAYGRQMELRENRLNAAEPGNDVVVPLLDVWPEMLFRHDGHLQEAPDAWMNRTVARYYDIGSVRGEELWALAAKEIEAAPEGATLTYAAGMRDVVPLQVMAALRGRAITLVLERPGERYVLDGRALDALGDGLHYRFADLAALGYRDGAS
jgi:hypothetical protein